MYVLLYLIVKYAFYSLWCYVGIRTLQPESFNEIPRAARLGAYRVLLSLVFGFTIGIIVGPINTVIRHDYLTYIVVYTPARIIEWGIIALLIVEYDKTALWSKKSYLWVAGGILVSFLLTDLPVFAILGGPFTGKIGRVFC